MTTLTQERWLQFWRFYKDQPHQNEALRDLYDQILKADKSILTEEAAWRQRYSSTQITGPNIPNPLNVPYQTQIDNASGHGWRECFSSSCAMVAMYYGRITNDDEYNKVRSRFGDSTSSQAQLQALRHLGLKVEFKTNGRPADLERLIKEGRPIPVGWLHHGHVSNPSGGGHWTVIIGHTANTWIHHDPYGEANMVNGGYIVSATKGKLIHYSRRNWDPRWMVKGTGGWYLDIAKA
jgi:hypothetical protein